ncbi:MAG: DUF3311 domain-containing protein [Planctomycetaceae bacterium]
MKVAVWALVVLLIILHQDFWYWDDATLVGGIVPIGLAYHAGVSMAAAFTWFLATKFAWPLDESDDGAEGGQA